MINTFQRIFVSAFLIALCALAAAQIPTGTWREHLPYGETIAVTKGAGKIFCATPFAVFSYDPNDQSIERLSRVNKLSATNVTTVNFDHQTASLLVGYANGQIDIITQGVPFALDDIVRSNLLGNKRVNHIFVDNSRAFVCTGFGVVVIDIQRREVVETWFLQGQSNLTAVYGLNTDGERWYAATQQGIFTGAYNSPLLVSFEAWSRLDELPLETARYNSVTIVDNLLYAVRENGFEDELWVADKEEQNWTIVPGFESEQITDFRFMHDRLVVSTFNRVRVFDSAFNLVEERFSVAGQPLFPRAALFEPPNRVWVANEFRGMHTYRMGIGSQLDERILPNGPPAFNARRISAWNSNIWIASGGVDGTWTNNFDKKGFFGLVADQWVVVPENQGVNDIPGINDILAVAVDPQNNDRVCFGSWEEGLIEVVNGQITAIYNETNSSLQKTNFGGSPRIGVPGAAFDTNGNLWFSNAYSSDRPLQVLTESGEFITYNFQPQVTTSNFIADLLPTRQGFIWGVLQRGNGLIVFDHNGTLSDPSDDRHRVLTNQEGNGGLPNNEVFCVEEDLNGEIWVGTLQGVAVFYAPFAIFDDGNNDAQQILIEQDGNIQILLETEQVNAIVVDGANRKWIGTASSGVFVLSANGQDQINHFTTSNSPLLSNNVLDIAFNYATGEAFFATDRGVISYMADATNFVQEIEDIRIYPNPVRNNYIGPITIDGLAFDSDVRITNTAGDLVFATRSNGGRAIWDGNGRDGRRVATGIYLVFAAAPDGSTASVGKVAVIGN